MTNHTLDVYSRIFSMLQLGEIDVVLMYVDEETSTIIDGDVVFFQQIGSSGTTCQRTVITTAHYNSFRDAVTSIDDPGRIIHEPILFGSITNGFPVFLYFQKMPPRRYQ